MTHDDPSIYGTIASAIVLFIIWIFAGTAGDRMPTSKLGKILYSIGFAVSAFAVASFSLGILFALSISIGLKLTPEFNATVEFFSKPLNSIYLAPCIFLALFLYRLRAGSPKTYGIIEIIVGTLSIWIAFATQSATALSRVIGILGGIYIIIRGLDNFDKGLSNGKLKIAWDMVFPKFVAKSETPNSVVVDVSADCGQ